MFASVSRCITVHSHLHYYFCNLEHFQHQQFTQSRAHQSHQHSLLPRPKQLTNQNKEILNHTKNFKNFLFWLQFVHIPQPPTRLPRSIPKILIESRPIINDFQKIVLANLSAMVSFLQPHHPQSYQFHFLLAHLYITSVLTEHPDLTSILSSLRDQPKQWCWMTSFYGKVEPCLVRET